MQSPSVFQKYGLSCLFFLAYCPSNIPLKSLKVKDSEHEVEGRFFWHHPIGLQANHARLRPKPKFSCGHQESAADGAAHQPEALGQAFGLWVSSEPSERRMSRWRLPGPSARGS